MVHRQCVSECASDLYFWCPYALRKGSTPPHEHRSTSPMCVLQYTSRLHFSTLGKILVVVVSGMFMFSSRWTFFRAEDLTGRLRWGGRLNVHLSGRLSGRLSGCLTGHHSGSAVEPVANKNYTRNSPPALCPPFLGDRKNLSIAKTHPQPSQEFSEQLVP